MKKKVTIAQISIRENEAEENAAKIRRIIEENRETDLIVFPELVLQGHRMSTAPRHEMIEALEGKGPSYVLEDETRSLNEEIHDFAKQRRTNVIFGEMDYLDGHVYNLAVYVGRHRIEKYAKTHVHWTENFTPGTELKTFESSIGRIGVLICFDTAFPEAARVLALRGARTIVAISAIPEAFDIEYELIRLRAIAHNNQVYVIFANRAGEGFSGGSCIIDPRGMLESSLGEAEEVSTAELDLSLVDIWRQEESIYPHRRPALYRELCNEE